MSYWVIQIEVQFCLQKKTGLTRSRKSAKLRFSVQKKIYSYLRHEITTYVSVKSIPFFTAKYVLWATL